MLVFNHTHEKQIYLYVNLDSVVFYIRDGGYTDKHGITFVHYLQLHPDLEAMRWSLDGQRSKVIYNANKNKKSINK